MSHEKWDDAMFWHGSLIGYMAGVKAACKDDDRLDLLLAMVKTQAKLEDVERENAKLQKQSEQLFDKTLELATENTKLRELARDYLIFYSQPGCTYCFCHDECRESEEPCMAFERLVDRTNELGIEVQDGLHERLRKCGVIE